MGQTLSDQLVISEKQLEKHNRQLASSLSFSHFVELLQIDDPLKRIFYEIECIQGNWTVRELKRQIGSLLYERTGMSREKDLMIKIINEQASQLTHRLLKCHVLIELKTEKFNHTHVGQLNFYLNFYKKYEMSEGDNPPVGICFVPPGMPNM
ncbi:MAG: PDDEXK nuclease domain-containing protein [Acidobacteria bacterium]|nr:PDDEXK nuclease domain-containing protein [Acidobacteriota bacterium]